MKEYVSEQYRRPWLIITVTVRTQECTRGVPCGGVECGAMQCDAVCASQITALQTEEVVLSLIQSPSLGITELSSTPTVVDGRERVVGGRHLPRERNSIPTR